MAILKKIVPQPIIKDYRDQDGSYYEAKCDQCGRIYYPKRSTSKYCSKLCNTMYLNGEVLANKPIPDQEPTIKKKETAKERNQRIKDAINKIKEKQKINKTS
jgi:endogenous inhibitor of DNA gyrase (YacG/DUF329 family)